MDAQCKRAAMTEQRRRWMEGRQITLSQNEAYVQAKREIQQCDSISQRNEHTLPENGAMNTQLVGRVEHSELADESFLFNRLTEKVTKQIRQDLKEEMSNSINTQDMRDAMVDKMDQYLDAELHTHTCKICFELMTSPLHTPLLLFPCGHTFCKLCVEKHESDKRKKTSCPYCRQAVESVATNHSLKQLIDNFASQRDKIKEGSSNLNDIFGSCKKSGLIKPSRAHGKDGNSYKMQINANDMRVRILENQLEEDATCLEKVLKRKNNICAATSHLHVERSSVEERLQQLQEELSLIDTHLAEQQKKLREAAAHEDSLKEGMELMKMSISSIQTETDKLHILSGNEN